MDELSQEVLIIAFLSLFIIMITVAIISLVLVYQKRQMKFIKEKEKMVSLHKNELLQTRLEIQEQTFKNISQELHDNIGQVLSLVKLNINTMDCSRMEVMQEKINDSRVLITKAIQDLRDVSKSLDADYITETGLSDAIRRELEMVRKTHSYNIDFQVTGIPFTLHDQQQLVLLRIVQEALHNITEHAKASQIKISVTFGDEFFSLEIADDGHGFTYSDSKLTNAGMGLRNMQVRAKMIGAEINITSNPGAGTVITVLLSRSEQNYNNV